MSLWLVPLLPPLLFGGVLLQDPATGAASPDREAERELVVSVLEARADEDAEDQERALRALDPTPLASFVDLLAEGRIPADWSREADAPAALGPDSLVALRGALGKVPIEELRPFFETVVADEPRLDRRQVCVETLGALGTRRDLRLVIDLATPADELVRVLPRSLRKAYEGALRAILARDPAGLGSLQDVFAHLHPGLGSATIDALGDVPAEAALTTLVALLGTVRELDAYLLTTIAKLGPSVRLPVGEDVLARVRGFLSSPDPALVQAAVRASGRLEDYDAIPTLLEMLTQGDQNQRTSAHVALGDITGLPLRADVRIWRAWYDSESLWWQVESAGVFRDLEEPDELRVSGAINEVTRQRLYRHERASALLPVLDRDQPELVVMACRSLAQVGSRVAVPRLVLALEHPDWNIRRAAWTALVRITGKELPPEADAWRAEVDLGQF